LNKDVDTRTEDQKAQDVLELSPEEEAEIERIKKANEEVQARESEVTESRRLISKDGGETYEEVDPDTLEGVSDDEIKQMIATALEIKVEQVTDAQVADYKRTFEEFEVDEESASDESVPKRIIQIVSHLSNKNVLQKLVGLFNEGYVLDPDIRHNPVVIDLAAIYHLRDSEDIPVPEEDVFIPKVDFFDTVTGFQTVVNADVEKWMEKGYRILDKAHIYAKTTIMIKIEKEDSDVAV